MNGCFISEDRPYIWPALGLLRACLGDLAMTSEERTELSLAFAKVLYVNGQATDQIVAAIQRGLASGANEVFTFGHYESLITHFHRTLTAALAA